MSDIDDIEDKLKQLDQINSIINGMKMGAPKKSEKDTQVGVIFFNFISTT